MIKSMKLKFLAATCMALGSSAAFAVTVLPCDTTSPVAMANTCAPEVKMFIAGSSALGDALSIVVPADLFDTSVTPVTVIKDTSGDASANLDPTKTHVTGWYGMSVAAKTGGVSKRLFVVYNNNNGSAAGVSQVLNFKPAGIVEADIVTVGPTAGVANTCSLVSAADTTTIPPTLAVVKCTTHAPTQADLAISDVAPVELYKLETPMIAGVAGKLAVLTTLTSAPLALQGFGVVVNDNLYKALQTKNLAEGLLPSSCSVGDATAACQPSVKSAEYASLITKQGSIKSAAALLNNTSDATPLILARRDDLSGTQASSNIFFADNSCGNSHDAKGKLIKGVLGGQLDIISSVDYPAPASGATPALVVQSNAATSNVKTAVNTNVDALGANVYAIGVLSLNTTTGGSGKFVKIDGVSPTFNADNTPAYKQRTRIINGDYPFAMTAFAAWPTKPVKKSVNDAVAGFPQVLQTVVSALQDSTAHDLLGIGYIDGVADSGTPKQSKVHRTLGNNCSPLIM